MGMYSHFTYIQIPMKSKEDRSLYNLDICHEFVARGLLQIAINGGTAWAEAFLPRPHLPLAKTGESQTGAPWQSPPYGSAPQAEIGAGKQVPQRGAGDAQLISQYSGVGIRVGRAQR
jgi:hypothetical protein